MRLKLYLPLAIAVVAGPITAHAVSVNAPSTPTSAQDRSVGTVRREGHSQARPKSFAVIMRDSGNNAITRERGIHTLVVARSDK